jgi:hypothetical protein
MYLEKELLELGRGQQHLGTSPKGLLRVFSRLSQTISEHQHTEQVDDASRSRLER